MGPSRMLGRRAGIAPFPSDLAFKTSRVELRFHQRPVPASHKSELLFESSCHVTEGEKSSHDKGLGAVK